MDEKSKVVMVVSEPPVGGNLFGFATTKPSKNKEGIRYINEVVFGHFFR